ncbi:MAG: Succinyl-diaminopimelate desuccinylase [Chlamydiales bacterium]|nr:Succinyl-diaminopimelate desuccinylase [Chlamydiales bacterium]
MNVGLVKGGIASNIIPESAECHVNVRADLGDTLERLDQNITTLCEHFHLQLLKESYRPPKPFDSKTEHYFEILKRCAQNLNRSIKWEPTGGVCDGNFTGAKGIPTLDTLGVNGGKIHTEKEYIDIRSLKEKTDLLVLFLQEIATCPNL